MLKSFSPPILPLGRLKALVPSGGGSIVEVQVSFTFMSGTIPLAPVAAGSVIDAAWVRVDVPFDDPAASLSMGTPLAPAIVFALADVDLTSANQYTNQAIETFALASPLALVISPAGSTQGSGLLVYRYVGS